MHEPIDVRASGSPKLEELLRGHPFVRLSEFKAAEILDMRFERDGWKRRVSQGYTGENALYGLPELMDNNPLVCADAAACTGPAATLAAIALNPLAKAGLLQESPAIVFSFEGDLDEVDRILASEGWNSGAFCTSTDDELNGCCPAAAFASIKLPADESEIDALYEECFGRSFFVRRHQGDDWSPELVRDKPFAVYNLLLTPGEDGLAVLRIDALADSNGKCGAAQLVHMLNIMAGFEEDLGLNY